MNFHSIQCIIMLCVLYPAVSANFLLQFAESIEISVGRFCPPPPPHYENNLKLALVRQILNPGKMVSSVSPACRKRRLNGAGSRNNHIKWVAPCRCRRGTLMNPTKCLWRWEPDHRSNFFFSPPAHLCRHIYN